MQDVISDSAFMLLYRRMLRTANENYGGRYIRVHEPWIKDPTQFALHLMTLEGCADGTLMLDRTNNDGHYEPGNLRFVTAKVSANNRRKHGTYGRLVATGKASRMMEEYDSGVPKKILQEKYGVTNKVFVRILKVARRVDL